MSGVSLEICSSLESIYPGQNTERGRSCLQGWAHAPGLKLPQIVLFDVGHFDRNRCHSPGVGSNLGDDTKPESIQHFINETIGSLFHRR